MTIDPSWSRVKELFQAAIERTPEERDRFLGQACGTDEALRREVDSLLASHRAAEGFAERPALEVLSEPRSSGPYQLLSPIGRGGMGEVYRARDTSLGRDVAIKILPPEFAADRERLARFDREAHLLASLNHPNICAIYGLADINGAPGLVLELVEGQTLEERLTRLRASGASARQGRMRLDEALRIARAITRALEAAHDRGIIHRDLKPANIKIAPDGHVKVLDFGLAKAVADTAAAEAAVHVQTAATAEGLSQSGMLLGTAAYMSPEQARGEPLDKRTDIWSFGCVLFELLTRRPALKGATISDTIAAVLEREPDWTLLPASTPPIVERVLRRCLEKDVKLRLKDIGDAGLDLDEALSSPRQESAKRARGWVTVPWLVASAAVVAALAALFWRSPSARVAASAPRRVSAEFGTDAALVTFQFGEGSAAILSPDGTTIAFVAQRNEGAPRQIYVRRLDQLRAEPLAGTEGALNPFFSPDGQWVAFFAGGALKKTRISGADTATLCPAVNNRGGAWGDGGTIAFAPNRDNEPLWQVSSDGGEPKPLTVLTDGETTHRWPQLLGSRAVLYTAHSRFDGFDGANIVVQALPNGPRKLLVRGAYAGRYVSSGHLVYVHNGALYAAPFNLNRLELTGPPVVVLEGAAVNAPVGAAEIAFSETGTVAYLPAPAYADYLAAPMDWLMRDGTSTPLRPTPARWLTSRFAPDGQRLALTLFDGSRNNVWVYEWARDASSRVTSDGGTDPVWTPDGQRIVFSSIGSGSARRSELFWRRADGSGESQRLTTTTLRHTANSWHRDGRLLAFTEFDDQGVTTVGLLSVDGDEASGWRPSKPTRLLANASDPEFSPDGRWLAYVAREPGRERVEVYVKPFPGPGGPWLVSPDGGDNPTWSATRPELYFGSADHHIMSVSYSASGDSFRADKPRVVPNSRFSARIIGRSFDLHPDGNRFALAAAPDVTPTAKRDHIVLVFSFFDELRRLAPVR